MDAASSAALRSAALTALEYATCGFPPRTRRAALAASCAMAARFRRYEDGALAGSSAAASSARRHSRRARLRLSIAAFVRRLSAHRSAGGIAGGPGRSCHVRHMRRGGTSGTWRASWLLRRVCVAGRCARLACRRARALLVRRPRALPALRCPPGQQLERRQHEDERLSRACLGLHNNVLPRERVGQRGRLHGRGPLERRGAQRALQPRRDAHVGEARRRGSTHVCRAHAAVDGRGQAHARHAECSQCAVIIIIMREMMEQS